ncbi:uncharacterized protein CDAR_312181 [Caerostris darwini]|uniref:Gustatory receptor n=1 Tax=Caerostris darwini TaxID=1538125 RepID=A0AAV4X1D1_9ARAC|nr:uncharacterized protein CDAR_312181 [Caerostris darwini]
MKQAHHLNTFAVDLTKAVKMVKGINDLLSPVIFCLMTFWMTRLFYNLTKIIYGSAFEDSLTYASTVSEVFNYGIQYFVLIMVSSEMPLVLSKMKSRVLHIPVEHPDCSCERAIFGIQLTLQLDNFKEEVTVTAMNFLKLDRNVILVSLGAVVTYELLIVQILKI